jgi:hypothetical protein
VAIQLVFVEPHFGKPSYSLRFEGGTVAAAYDWYWIRFEPWWKNSFSWQWLDGRTSKVAFGHLATRTDLIIEGKIEYQMPGLQPSLAFNVGKYIRDPTYCTAWRRASGGEVVMFVDMCSPPFKRAKFQFLDVNEQPIGWFEDCYSEKVRRGIPMEVFDYRGTLEQLQLVWATLLIRVSVKGEKNF